MSKAEIRKLLAEIDADKYAKYDPKWQGRAVACLNEIYMDADRYDDEIYDLCDERWDDLVKWNLERRGFGGLLYFIGKIEPSDDYAYIDAYGNAVALHADDLAGLLRDELAEMERDE